MGKSDSEHLAWFLGPKAENRFVFENLLNKIAQDYSHWRSNYHPEDAVALSRGVLRDLEQHTDRLEDGVGEMLALLRRNFPFYSPRYLAHMLSDVTLPSMLGYFAGMLYNANNVSTEAAPVTVEMELDACNLLLRMFGFKAAPKPKRHEDQNAYLERLPPRFGWAHSTFDGTTANLEALWVARTVKFLPLAIRDSALPLIKDDKIASFRLGPDDQRKIGSVSHQELMLLSPTQCFLLLDQYLQHVATAFNQHDSLQKRTSQAWEHLRTSEYHVGANGMRKVLTEFQPIIYLTGAAHYSLRKALDILGLGEGCVQIIKMTPAFRMDVRDLACKIRADLKTLGAEHATVPRRVPFAVVPVCGTTEEGAVDPIADIVKLRQELEHTARASFWLHIDAAWGGYIRSLFRADDQTSANEAFSVLIDYLGVRDGKGRDWDDVLGPWIKANISPELARRFRSMLREAGRAKARGDYEAAKVALYDVIVGMLRDRTNMSTNEEDQEDAYHSWYIRLRELRQKERLTFVRALAVDFEPELFGKKIATERLAWDDPTVLAAFWAMHDADSIVCDPHKMGYCVYPSGSVAFADNRVRACVRRDVPYISASTQRFINMPPRYPSRIHEEGDVGRASEDNELPLEPTVAVETMGNTILEGSRPGAVATALWLSTKVIPLTRERHGRIVLASLRAARMLYAYIKCWNDWELPVNVELHHVPCGPPDSNVVVFVVKKRNNGKLRKLNEITDRVYQNFSIRTELGE